MVAVTPAGIGRRRRPARRSGTALVIALAMAAFVLALAWSFAAAGGLRTAPPTRWRCEQLWNDGRYTVDLASADRDAFITACLAR